MLKYLLKAPDSTWAATSPAQAKAENLKIKYLGTWDYFFSDQHRTCCALTFISCPNLWQTFSQPLLSDPVLVKQYIPYADDDVLIGHAHYDHSLMHQSFVKQTGQG